MDCPAIGSADGEAIIFTSVSDQFRHSNVERLSRRPGRRSASLTGRMLAHYGKSAGRLATTGPSPAPAWRGLGVVTER